MVYTYLPGITNYDGAEGEWKHSCILSLTSALDGGGWSTPALGSFTTRNDHQVLIVYEAGWAKGPVWTGAENSALPGFDPRTVQPVANRYTG